MDNQREQFANDVLRRIDDHLSKPPVPRDVLVLLSRWEAFGKAMLKAGSILPRNLVADTESALADRYSSQVQPEPVNRQMLGVLEAIATAEIFDPLASAVAMQTIARSMLNSIAAAEAQEVE